jgi:hypothetical protein
MTEVKNTPQTGVEKKIKMFLSVFQVLFQREPH